MDKNLFAYVMVGLPGSGKSTYAKYLKERLKADVIISTDDIREEICGNATDQSKNTVVFRIAYDRLLLACSEGKSVVFDATNLTKESRASVLFSIPDYYNRVAVVLDTPLPECVERNKQRERVVPENVICKMSRKFKRPSYSEGFDEILEIQSTGK